MFPNDKHHLGITTKVLGLILIQFLPSSHIGVAGRQPGPDAGRVAIIGRVMTAALPSNSISISPQGSVTRSTAPLRADADALGQSGPGRGSVSRRPSVCLREGDKPRLVSPSLDHPALAVDESHHDFGPANVAAEQHIVQASDRPRPIRHKCFWQLESCTRRVPSRVRIKFRASASLSARSAWVRQPGSHPARIL